MEWTSRNRITPGDVSRGEIQVLSEDLVWKNKVVRLLNAHVQFPETKDGKHVEDDLFRLAPQEGKGNGVVAAPIDEEDNIILVRQFRHPVRLWMMELPRGAREENESPEDAVRRELKEEIGAEVLELKSLGRVAPDSGQLSTIPFLFAARVRLDKKPQQEDTEAIDRIVSVPFSELYAACCRGELIDGFTLATVLRLSPYVQNGVLEWERIEVEANIPLD